MRSGEIVRDQVRDTKNRDLMRSLVGGERETDAASQPWLVEYQGGILFAVRFAEEVNRAPPRMSYRRRISTATIWLGELCRDNLNQVCS